MSRGALVVLHQEEEPGAFVFAPLQVSGPGQVASHHAAALAQVLEPERI